MSPLPPPSRRSLFQPALFAVLLSLAVILQLAFLADMVRWRTAPDIGWIPMPEFGPKAIGFTSALGEEAGLRKGDRIVAVEGKPYVTLDDLYTLIDFRIGHNTVYTLSHDGRPFTVSVTTRELGLDRVIVQSGLTWLLGLIFLAIGTLVFLMKPFAEASWAFFLMTASTGLFITYMSPSFFHTPALLHSVALVIPAFIPASIIHLTAVFPQRQAYLADRRWLLAMPYVFSFVVAAVARAHGERMSIVPSWVLYLLYLYMFVALVTFLGSIGYSYSRTRSVAVRLQSLVTFSGLTVALFVPMVELLSNLLFGVSFFTNQILFYLVFLLFFPLSIGYAIVRHDLFEIDVIVRRTYGYVLSTAGIVGAYGLVASALNVTFHSAEVSRSPLFSVGFALAVVFLFEPLHKRLQRVVDRAFYRQRYDYRTTIRNISEAMTSILDPEVIHRTLVETVRREMFLENGLLLLPDATTRSYRVQIAEAVDPQRATSIRLGEGEAILRLMHERHEPVLRQDLDLDPRYGENRGALRTTFEDLASDLMIPMTYKGEIRGVVSLGRKKSGKMFTAEDLDLLRTITSQSVIALENAKLFQESLEKARLDEELKIAHTIQASMLPERPPRLPGFQIAARSIPAREVGGDFYDFIEIGTDGAPGSLAIVIGDVSGKAVSGALVMAAARSIFRVLAESHQDVANVVSAGNLRLKRDITEGMFVALLYAVLEPNRQTLTLTNAGQTEPILCPTDGSKPYHIDTEGDRFPLGIVADCEYQATEVGLRPGDTVVFYTDGVVEAMNDKGELYGFDRLLAAIDNARGLSAEPLLSALVDDVSRYVGGVEQHDDLTIVVVKVD